MKKIITSILLVLGLVILVACDPVATETDTTKPVIMGADPATITVGDEFDPLEGVTAEDDVDGEITLTAANITGTVNTEVAGEYTLTYKVEDAAGNEAEKTRVVTVVAPAPLGNLIGGDFERSAITGVDGWVTWFDDSEANGYDAAFSIEDGVAVIDIIASGEMDTQWWAVQVQYNKIMLEPFVSYTLEFRVRADETRYMNYQIQGGGIPDGGKAFGEANFTEVTTTWQTITKDFYVKGDAVDAQLQFAFGNFHEETGVPEAYRRVLTKVYLDDIKIVEGPELENQAPVVTAPDLFIKTGTPIGIKSGISVQDDFSPITVADVTVVQSQTDEIVFDPANPAKGVYTFTVTAEDEEGLETELTRKITVADPWNRPTTFAVTAEGGWDVANAPGWFLRQVDQEDSENWLSYTDDDAGEVAITIEKIASGDWMASYRVGDIMFFAGEYTITFEVKADDARDLRIAIEGAGLELTEAFKHIQVTTDWTTVTLTYNFETDQMNKGLDFWFGTLTINRLDADPNPYTAADDVLTTMYFRNLEVSYEA
ncbi:MAG: immunoglobulin-like domain-containing protein [Acholeplasma sp.]